MKVKIVWLVVSSLLVVALGLASCGPAVTEEEEEEIVTEEEEEEVAEEEEEEPPVSNEPTYGGVLVQGLAAGPSIFDTTEGGKWMAPTLKLTNESLLTGDWAKGPAGTAEENWRYVDGMPNPDVLAGALAESWDLADPQTLVLTIRQGVHWHDKPPTNGREMTADDIAFSLNRLWDSPKSYQASSMPRGSFIESITATDKWTVTIRTLPGKTGEVWEAAVGWSRIVPRDAVEFYGDLNDWENTIGTGPFILTDYIDQSSVTFERNANYWMKDPLRPQNQLPYVDGVKWLIIPDLSTRLAALRTAKVDMLEGTLGAGISWEDGEDLLRTSP